jgi:hypothetical protein
MAPTTFLIAELYSEASLSRVGHSALPRAPIRPEARRWRRIRRTNASASR